MDRYTYRSKENPLWVGTIDHSNGTESENSQCVQRLCELEDRIESGLLLELPCKVGDRVYYIDEYIAEFGKVEEYTVERIEIVKDGIKLWFGDSVGYAWAENFGKEVFTDESQAEAKLKELQGKE